MLAVTVDGGRFGCALYGGLLRVDPERPGWPARDRFVRSKGHGAGLYAVLAT
jgi:transketolase